MKTRVIIQPDSPNIAPRSGWITMYNHTWDDSVFFDTPVFNITNYLSDMEKGNRFLTDTPNFDRNMIIW